MPATYKENGGSVNGSNKVFTYDFPTLQTEDVKVSLNGATQATTKYTVSLSPANITFNNNNVDSSVQESDGSPKSGVTVRVYRETTVGKTDGNEDPKAVFAAGSSIRAADLNNNQEQALFAIHELQEHPIKGDAVGAEHIEDLDDDVKLLDDKKVIFGTGDDAYIKHSGDFTTIRNDNGSIGLYANDTSFGSGNGNVHIQGQNSVQIRPNAADDGIYVKDGGAVELYHSGSKKVETTATGATVTGTLTANLADDSIGVDQLSATGTPSSSNFLRGDNTWGSYTAGTGLTLSGNEFSVDAVALTTVQTAANQSAMLALTTQEGDVVVRSDENKSYVKNSGTAGTMADFTLLKTPTDAVLSVNGNTGAISAAQIASAVEAASDSNTFTDAEKTKLSGVDASANNYSISSDLLDEDDMASDSATKVPSQQSVKAYVDANSGGGGSGISNVVEDTTPQLGGDLDVQTSEITTSTTNGNVKLTPNGTGLLEVKGNTNPGTIQLNCESNSHGVKIKGPAHSASASYTLTLPDTDGSANQVLKTDGSGNLDWVAQTTDTNTQLSNAEVRAAVEAASDSNVFTDDDHTKLNGIAASANNYVHPNHSGEVTSTADGATVIADNVVDEANLKVSNSPTNGYFLQAQSGNDGGLTWAEASGGSGVSDGDKGDITVSSSGATWTIDNDAITNAKVADDAIGVAELSATGTASSSTYLRGDNTWATVSGGGGGGVTSDSDGNTVGGSNAGEDLASGATSNTFFGKDAGKEVTTGDNNVAIGDDALQVATTASNNIAIGKSSLTQCTGGNNIALGTFSLDSLTSGEYNLGLGYESGGALTTGGKNIAIGYQALKSETTLSESMAIGYQAGKNYIAIKGCFIGHQAGENLTDGSDNMCIGYQAGRNNGGIYGGGAGTYGNTWIGNLCGSSITGGNQNVGIGANALQNNSAWSNVAIGNNAGEKNTTGTRGTFIGRYAGIENTTGSYNFFAGYYSGGDITTGSNNTCIGDQAGHTGTNNLTTGSNNTLIGSSAAASSATVSNEVTIGDANVTKFRLPGLDGFQIDDNGTIDLPGAIDENVYELTGTELDPDLGTVQYKTLGANTTFTESLTAGQSMILMINDGSSYTITWPTIKWLGASAAGSAPTLATSGYTCIELWKVGSDLYGALIGVSS